MAPLPDKQRRDAKRAKEPGYNLVPPAGCAQPAAAGLPQGGAEAPHSNGRPTGRPYV